MLEKKDFVMMSATLTEISCSLTELENKSQFWINTSLSGDVAFALLKIRIKKRKEKEKSWKEKQERHWTGLRGTQSSWGAQSVALFSSLRPEDRKREQVIFNSFLEGTKMNPVSLRHKH